MYGFGQHRIFSIIHDGNLICKLTHKNCHLDLYHRDVKCHMTLNIIFCVAILDFQTSKGPMLANEKGIHFYFDFNKESRMGVFIAHNSC